MKTQYIVCSILLLALSACSDSDPVGESCNGGDIFVLNEGLWGSNNASIDSYCTSDNMVNQRIFTSANGVPLGDAATDMEFTSSSRDVIAVVLNGSGAIVLLDTEGTLLSTLPIPGDNPSPRQLFVGSGDWEHHLYVTDFRDSVYEIHVENPQQPLITRRWGTGPAPEDVMVVGHKLYVVNSGLGIYRKDEPNASTLLTINLESGTEIGYTELGPNPTTLAYDEGNDNLYCLYNHYQVGFEQDSLGGIQRIDPSSGQIEQQWRIANRSFSIALEELANDDDPSLYFVGPQGIVELNTQTGEESVVATSEFGPENALYSLALTCDNCLWYTNALDYQNNGTVHSACSNTTFTSGLIPAKVLFKNDCP